MQTRSIKIPDFIRFLESIATYSEGRKKYLFLDNLRLHHSKCVHQRASELNIEIKFNATYSSELMCCESVWAWSK